jgi:hypothetical protein
MDKKKLLIIGGVLLVAGVGAGIYFWKKGKDAKSSESDNKSVDSKSDDSNKSLKSKTETESEFPAPSSEKPAPASETPASEKGTGIKGLKGSDRRDFRKDTRATCEEKFGSGKDYRQCKRRVKKGGVPFEGDFDEFERDYMDFEGVGSYSSFQSQFDIDL